MPIESLTGGPGVYHPDDLRFLKSVYDDIVRSEAFNPSNKSTLADQLLYLFGSGIKDRELLYIAALQSTLP